MIQHDAHLAAGPQHAMNLTHGARRVGRVMQHAVRINDVETFIRKRQSLAIGNREIAGLSIDS